MAIHSTGAISFQDLINEFDVPNPISISQMYAGGAYVPEANAGVPKSGAISLGNFYGATAAYVLDYNITADMFNFNSSTLLANSSWDGVIPVILTVTIADGIVVSGDNTSTPAFIVNALPSGSQVFINNNGFIIGMGGSGGGGGGGVGASGGIALNTLTNTVITNAGTIGGGGGGGGGGATVKSGFSSRSAGGGGGRSGKVNSGGGSGTSTGSQGSFAAAGAGGVASSSRGGVGGTWGAAGAAGTGGGGGAGGTAVVGNSLINWVSEGTIMGSRLN